MLQMKTIYRDSWRQMEHKARIRLHNSLLGAKPVHLVGTRSLAGIDNLAVFNSACHVSSDPALIGMMCRPLTVRRDTYRNIQETGVWTLNAIAREFVAAAHRAADKLPAEASEFEHSGLEVERLSGFHAPCVAASPVKIGLELVEEVPIRSSGTVLLIGEVQWLRIPRDCLAEDSSLLVDRAGLLSSLGLDGYATVSECARFPYQSERS